MRIAKDAVPPSPRRGPALDAPRMRAAAASAIAAPGGWDHHVTSLMAVEGAAGSESAPGGSSSSSVGGAAVAGGSSDGSAPAPAGSGVGSAPAARSFICSFPGCSATFNKGWRLDAHLCSHTGAVSGAGPRAGRGRPGGCGRPHPSRSLSFRGRTCASTRAAARASPGTSTAPGTSSRTPGKGPSSKARPRPSVALPRWERAGLPLQCAVRDGGRPAAVVGQQVEIRVLCRSSPLT